MLVNGNFIRRVKMLRFDWLKLNNRTLHCEIVELDKQNKELWAAISVLQAQIAVLRNFHITENLINK